MALQAHQDEGLDVERMQVEVQHFHRDVPEYIPDDRVSSSYDGGQFPEELTRSPGSRHSEEYFEQFVQQE